jgi:hypothetical protein
MIILRHELIFYKSFADRRDWIPRSFFSEADAMTTLLRFCQGCHLLNLARLIFFKVNANTTYTRPQKLLKETQKAFFVLIVLYCFQSME